MRKPLFGKDRICAVVAAQNPPEMTRQIREALRFTRTLELRWDWLEQDVPEPEILHWV
ncbi:MAG: hypothetical protein HYR58_03795, partial [Acidobacteria bacterium]|nr:hypothetical protein [Acidobacteriota bacterium]